MGVRCASSGAIASSGSGDLFPALDRASSGDFWRAQERLQTEAAAAAAESAALRDELADARRSAEAAAAERREGTSLLSEAAAAAAHAAAAEAARDRADAARAAAEAARREADLALQAAAADEEAERGQRAEGVSEQLKADGQRRSRVFRNAVAAAVSRIQAELEAERNGLALRLRETESALADARHAADCSAAAAEAATAEATARTADAQAAGSLAAAEAEAAEGARAGQLAARRAAVAAEELQRAAEREAEDVRAQMLAAGKRAEAAEAAAAAARAAAASAAQRDGERIRDLEVELSCACEQAEAAVAAAAATSPPEELNRAGAAACVAALEREVAQLRASGGGSRAGGATAGGGTQPGSLLASLGLDSWREARLGGGPGGGSSGAASAGDVEAGLGKKVGGGVPGRAASRFAPAWLLAASVRQRVGRGRLSPHTLLLALYLAALHMAVLTSFARGPAACPPGEGREQFKRSYPRAARLQAPLALLAAVCSGTAACAAQTHAKGITFAVVAVVMVGIVGMTLVFIKPTNNFLLGHRVFSPAETMGLLRRWERWHAARTVASIAAFAVLVIVSLA
ncbi:hypothetical protein WJX81_008612 [Elliptochloris bilobata]|uniref:Uncharacterized protein n=1 Tax=Elliptochloris bilobata TaxID=381761 RepID=A0AAW1S8E3_9CHLO